MTRRCGECTLCCKLLPVRELGKGANERCRFQSHKGCRVYHQPRKGFPVSCSLWNCRWLVDPETTKLRRPDRSHYVVDIMPDLVRVDNNDTGESQEISVVVVWVDRAFPDAWRDPELLAIAEKNGTREACFEAQAGSRDVTPCQEEKSGGPASPTLPL